MFGLGIKFVLSLMVVIFSGCDFLLFVVIFDKVIVCWGAL